MPERAESFEELALRLRDAGDGTYQVQVVRSPYGCRDVRFDPGALGFPIEGLAGRLAPLSGSRDLGATVAAPVTELTPEEVGGALFRTLFRDDLLWTFLLSLGRIQGQQDLGLRLRLIFDPLEPGVGRLLALPWELLYRPDTRDFLARNRFTPVVRHLEVPRLTAPVELTSELRVLVVLANPEGTAGLDLAGERRQVETALGGGSRVRLAVLPKPSLNEVRAKLQAFDAHVLHFMGHGDFEPGSGEGFLIFEDSQGQAQNVPGSVLAESLKGLPSLRLVFLNACRTAQMARDPGQDPFSGVASALVLAGVPAVVAMQFPISDAAALPFSRRLYEMLAQGSPIDAAVAEARLSIHLEDPYSYEWATPALFLSVSDGRIFAAAPTTQAPEVPRPVLPEPPRLSVSDYRTVGGQGGITIGGSGNQIGSVNLSGNQGKRDHE